MSLWIGAMRWSQHERAWFGAIRMLPDGRAFVRYELTWLQKTPEFAAEEIRQSCARWGITLQSLVANHHLWPKGDETGQTISETFQRFSLPMRRGSEDRINGWSRLRSWLEKRPYPSGILPSLWIHADCQRLIRTLPTLVRQERHPDDTDDTPESYPADALRVFVMSRPIPGTPLAPSPPPPGTWGHELARFFEPQDERRRVGASLVR